MNSEVGLQIDLVGALRRQAGLVGIVAGVTFIASFWIAMLLPNAYESRVTMLVEPPSVSGSLVEAGVADSDLNTRLNLMVAQILARPRLSRIIDEFDLYPDLADEMTRNEIVEEMRSRISIVPVEGALVPTEGIRSKQAAVNTFQIFFTYGDAKTPPQVVQRLANDFIDKQLNERIEITQKSFEFIRAEETRLQESIRSVQDRIREIKMENPGTLPENLQDNQRQLMMTLMGLREAERSLVEATGDEKFWAQKGSTSQSDPDEGLGSPVGRLKVLELSIAAFRAGGFTDKHPDIVKAKQEITEIEASLERGRVGNAAGNTALSSQQLGVLAERDRAAQRVLAIRGEIARLKAEEQEVQGRTDRIPGVAAALDDLDRQWRQLSKNLGDFQNRRLEAAVQANLERRQLGEQFRILEPASPPPGPSAPNRPLILVLGLLFGAVFGVAAGVVREAVGGSLYDVLEVQSALSIPVLAAIPAISFAADIERKRRRKVWTAALVCIIAFLNFGGGIGGYFYVNGMPGWLKWGAVEEASEAPIPDDVPEEPQPEGDTAFLRYRATQGQV